MMVVVVSGADQPGMSVGGDYPELTEVQQCQGCWRWGWSTNENHRHHYVDTDTANIDC